MINDSQLDKNIIFLISQPRTGSTLLQRILSSHPDIHTTSEPWMMLHPIYALRSNGYKAEYGANLAWLGLQDFLNDLPNKEDEYYERLRQMYGHLYESAIRGSGKKFFLDKTPRYYFIIKDLYRIFPKAKFIILLRNPLAVLCSIITTWTNQNLFLLYRHKSDLIYAPNLLIEGINLMKNQCIVVHYEKLLIDPEMEIREICKKLEVKFTKKIIEYGKHNFSHWHFGDKKNIYKQFKPISQNIDKWEEQLVRPQVWRLVNDYLQLLGPHIFEQMGYSYAESLDILAKYRPNKIRLIFTLPMNRFLGLSKIGAMYCKFLLLKLRLSCSIRKRGIVGAINHAIKKNIL